MRSKMMFAMALTAFTMTACGDDSGNNGNSNNETTYVKPDGSSCGLASRSGVTECLSAFGGECQAGQYCDQSSLQCSVGCTSDNNCAGNQYCDITEGVGTCRNCVVQQPTEPDPVNPNPQPASGCDGAGAKVRACGATAAETASFIAGCKDGLADPDFKDIFEAVISCIDLAGTNCAEQAECLGDGSEISEVDPNPNPTPANDCAKAEQKAVTCDVLTASEAAELRAECEAQTAAGLQHEEAFCLANAPVCEAAEMCFF
jgi:hypothetical protein